MAYTVESKTNNPATRLRDALEEIERMIVQLRGDNIEQFLLKLDRTEEEILELHTTGGDFRPEQARWDSLLNRLHNQPEPLVRAAQVAGGLKGLRAKHPPATNFWWFLDQELNRRRQESARRTILTLLSIVAVVAGLLWAINTFFPPNPEAVLMVETTNTLDQLIAQEQWEEALQLINETRATLPAQPDLVVWQIVLNERLGRSAETQAAMQEAETLFSATPAQLWITLGTDRLQVGDIEGAEQAAQTARDMAPDEAQVYFLLGGIAETRGDIPTAIDYFDQTFNLAQNSSPQLAVIARVRMGQLLQSPGAFPTPMPEATATP
jgi:tetratricopeptide (TPR) repeat protein